MPRLIRAYIDETGDRGYSGKSSPFFAFAAVLVADEDEPSLRKVISELRREFKVPVGKALHWKEHVKNYERRQHVSRLLSEVPRLMVVYVVVEKASVPAGSAMLTDHETFYNYAAGLAMERILLAAWEWRGGTREVLVRFGHVRHFDHGNTTSYFRAKKLGGPSWIPWGCLRGAVHFDNQAAWDGLQAADQYAGMLREALEPDRYGGYEEHHLLRICHQIRRDSGGNAWGRGFKVLGNTATFTSLPWWPPEGI